MRVGFISYNAQARNAIGNHLADKLGFFQERGAELRVFVQSIKRLHPALRAYTQEVQRAEAEGPAWEFLSEADLVVVEYAQYYELLHFLPLLAGSKPRLLVDYHGVTPPQLWQGPGRENLARGQAMRGLVWCADAVLAHSQFTACELASATGYPAERIHRLGFPLDLETSRPGKPSKDWRARLGVGAARLLLFVGRLAANKRVPVLIEALAQLKNLEPPIHALILGDDGDLYSEEMRRCRDLAQRLGIEDRVHFHGQVDDAALADAYRSADVLVMPSVHEGFCLPVLEAQAHGLPVIAARAAALPETVGDAGLAFTPDDAGDLSRQLTRVLTASRRVEPDGDQPRRSSRVAIVCFRFGPGIVGGAETSLKTIAQALKAAGCQVEVYTTCTDHESRWTNDLPEGTTTWDGLTIHRFAIDPHDREQHLRSNRRLLEADRRLSPQEEEDYLRHSVHSTKLVERLRESINETDAIITGPYLFGLTCDIARAFPEKTLLLPCFHDEPHARLQTWHEVYGAVGGILYHSPEEQAFVERELGFNHPSATQVGTLVGTLAEADSRAAHERPYLVYCGRFSQEKNLPLLLGFLQRHYEQRGHRFDVTFVGQGDMPLPKAPWVCNRGHVAPDEKMRLLEGAAALVQLSTHESLSLVALEAWAVGVPVIAHRDCAVLAGQIERSQAGRTIGDYETFAAALDELADTPASWRRLGENGRAYVNQHYRDTAAFTRRLLDAIENLHIPLAEQMRRRGLRRAKESERRRWSECFGQLVDGMLHQAPISAQLALRVQPLRPTITLSSTLRTLLIPVRVVNDGSLPALAEGPARSLVMADICEAETGRPVAAPQSTLLPGLLRPARSLPAAVTLTAPTQPGDYQIRLWACRHDREPTDRPTEITLSVTSETMTANTFLDTVQETLAEAHRLQRLPDDYVDVTLGRFARLKRWLKRKVLGNFKTGYIDVLSRQQSQVNQQLVTAVQQLAECCVMLEHAVRGLQEKWAGSNQDEKENHKTREEYYPQDSSRRAGIILGLGADQFSTKELAMDNVTIRAAVLVEQQYQEMEVWYPVYRLREAGCKVTLVGPEAGATYPSKLGYPAKSDKAAKDVRPDDFDILVIPGGFAPDFLRRHESIIKLVSGMVEEGKIVAAICHGPWVLCSTQALKGRKATCFFAIKDDVMNAGGKYVDAEVVRDGNLITSRKPDDLPAFLQAILQAAKELKPALAGAR